MRRVHCAGCGATEVEGTHDPRITQVSLVIQGPHHTRSWEQTEEHSEDLCPDCVKSILSKFFQVGEVSTPRLLREVV